MNDDGSVQVELKNVGKRFADRTVLEDISLRVRRGQFVALLGPSGCGKTTLLNILAGLIGLGEGAVEFDGAPWSSRGYTLAPERRNVGMVFQDFALWPHMTVFDNVAFGLKVKKPPDKQFRTAVSAALEMVQMSGYENYYPHQLSGGQKQRIAIARTLAPRPSLMLMDEPLSNLDSKLREQMRWDLLNIVQEANITTIYVTHDQTEALSMADHLVLLNEGRIEQQGAPSQVYREPATVFAASFLGAANVLHGRVTGRSGKVATVDCLGKKIQAISPASVGEKLALIIRPAEIHVGDSRREVEELGTRLHATVEQRAFQGTNWQYRVAVDADPERVLEVQDSSEYPIGESLRLWMPAGQCRLVTARLKG